MEITDKIKAKVFGQYLGQVAEWKNTEYTNKYETEVMWDNLEFFIGNKALLRLKPLSEISDSEAVEVAKMQVMPFIPYSETKKYLLDKNILKYSYMMNINQYQYLQEIGYDLPNYLLGGKTLQECGLATYE